MASEARRTVGDYATLHRGITYSGTLVGESGPPLLGLGSIEPGGGFRSSSYKTFGGECPRNLMVEPGGIYVALKGATKDGSMVGSVARLPRGVPSGRLTQDTARMDFRDPDPEVAAHVYWVLRTPQYRQYCAGRLTGSAAASFSRSDLLAYPIPPVTRATRALVHVLDAVEDKIELNRRLNETLEAMARALFKSWFVDFDPVRAKAEGRDPGLPQPILDLFPARFEDADLVEVPVGWRSTTLAEFALLNPESWSTANRPGTLDYVDLSNTKWGRIDAITTHHSSMAPSRAQRVLRPGDTIVGTVRPGNGSYALVNEDGLTGSTGFAVLRPLRPEFTEFVYLAATDRENIEALAHLADGAAYPAVRPEAVLATSVVHEPDDVAGRFSELTRPMLRMIAVSDAQSRTLAEIRDVLLPMLVSGELRGSEAERVLEAARA